MFDRISRSALRVTYAVGTVLALQAVAPAASAVPTLLFEASTGRILYAEDLDDQWHPASLTKMMTAYVTFAALKAGKITLETPLPYSENASQQPPSKIGLPVGSTITVDTALQALVIKSANDIAVALSEGIGGSQDDFVSEMNATAKRLGMSRTQFRNPHGLPAAEQVTTARDLARLAAALLRDFPDRAHYWAQTQMEIGKVKIASHNGLFKTLEGADGMKTGFICDSGFNIVASATREGTKLVAVVLGQPTVGDRNTRAQELLEHGYATMGWKQLLGANENIATLPLAANAKDASSIREQIVSFECHARRVARATAAARKRGKQRVAVENAQKKGAEKAGVAPSQTQPPQKAKAAPAAKTTAPKQASGGPAPTPAPVR